MTTRHGRPWSSETGLPSCLWRKPVVSRTGKRQRLWITSEWVGLMGHRVPPLVECYTGGSSRAPRRRRSVRCCSPCGGAAPLLVEELLLSLEVVIMLLLLHGSFHTLMRSGEEDCEQAASCHKLPASFPPYCNIDSFKHLSKKCTCLFIFLTWLKPIHWNGATLTTLILWGCTNQSFSPFLFALVGLDYHRNCFAFHPWQEKNSETWSNNLVELTDLTPSNQHLVTCY